MYLWWRARSVTAAFPFTPGGEFAGTISRVAADVTQWQVGDDVFAACGHGALAEQISVPAKALRAKPPGMSHEGTVSAPPMARPITR